MKLCVNKLLKYIFYVSSAAFFKLITELQTTFHPMKLLVSHIKFHESILAVSIINMAIILLLFTCNTCKAQQKDTLIKNNSAATTSVTGSIIDAVTGKPLPYVSIGF
ncbi:MAG: hypothetical protein JWR05_2982, partial [Mucilaginibacter sp.]|nr:hypothetical protein [Mucilaginibacter sp.]